MLAALGRAFHHGDGAAASSFDATVAHVWPLNASCAPAFMIIGAPKCATTSMFEYLAQHPQVREPTAKELCLFSRHASVRHVASWSAYVDAMRGKHIASSCELLGQRAFEACPFYLSEPTAADAILGSFPTVQAIALVRNPIDRTVSAFHDRHPLGYLAVPGSGRDRLEPTLLKLIDRVAASADNHTAWEDFELRLITNGIYVHGLRHWAHAQQRVSRSPAPESSSHSKRQLLIVRTEDLSERPQVRLSCGARAAPGLSRSCPARGRALTQMLSAGRPALASAEYNGRRAGLSRPPSRARPGRIRGTPQRGERPHLGAGARDAGAPAAPRLLLPAVQPRALRVGRAARHTSPPVAERVQCDGRRSAR